MVLGSQELHNAGFPPARVWDVLAAKLHDPYPRADVPEGHAFKVLKNMAVDHTSLLLACWSSRLCGIVHAHFVKVMTAVAMLTPSGLKTGRSEDRLPWDAPLTSSRSAAQSVDDKEGSKALCTFIRDECLVSAHLELQAVGLHFLSKAVLCAAKEREHSIAMGCNVDDSAP